MYGCLEKKRGGAARRAGKRSSSTTTGARHAGMSRTGTGEGGTFQEDDCRLPLRPAAGPRRRARREKTAGRGMGYRLQHNNAIRDVIEPFCRAAR